MFEFSHLFYKRSCISKSSRKVFSRLQQLRTLFLGRNDAVEVSGEWMLKAYRNLRSAVITAHTLLCSDNSSCAFYFFTLSTTLPKFFLSSIRRNAALAWLSGKVCPTIGRKWPCAIHCDIFFPAGSMTS